MATPDELVCLGAIAGAWGVRGAVRLKSFCADPAAIATYGPLVTEDGRSFGVSMLKPLAGAFAANLTGIATREAAEALKGTRLYAPRSRLPALVEDEFYHADLIGLEVVDTRGTVLGRVRAVADHGAGDILEIARPGAAEILVPFTRQAVPTVDLAAGRIVVDPPPGLIGKDDG
jgi:16S rRNA processing protein RimM